MKRCSQGILILASILSFFSLLVFSPPQVLAVNAKFDVNKMGDMSDFDPNSPAMIPTGDTIKVAIVASFSGPAAKVLPLMDQKLDRCKGKNNWGE